MGASIPHAMPHLKWIWKKYIKTYSIAEIAYTYTVIVSQLSNGCVYVEN